jgi:hypothetical protein
MIQTPTIPAVNVLALVKQGPPSEQYVILFRDGCESEVRRQLGLWASEPELSFSWFDAAKANQRLREGLG